MISTICMCLGFLALAVSLAGIALDHDRIMTCGQILGVFVFVATLVLGVF